MQPIAMPIKQNGFVVIMLLLILTLGISSYLLSEIQFSGLGHEREEKTAHALAQAKKVLMARMITTTGGNIPNEIGTLTCPDINNDGVDNRLNCGATALIPAVGRIPFQTLDVAPITDGYNEVVWYAFPDMLDMNGSINANYDNLDNANNLLTLDGQPMAFIIIAPGSILAGQSRRTFAERLDDNNYFEDSNADGDYSFVSRAPAGVPFNDRVIGVTRAEYQQFIEEYIFSMAGVIQQALDAFFNNAANEYYPYPEDALDTACDVNSSFTNLEGYYIGKLPTSVAAGCSYTNLNEFNTFSPSIIDTNNWGDYIWYAVSPDCTQDNLGTRCDESGVQITLDDNLGNPGSVVRQKYILFFGRAPQDVPGNNCGGTNNIGPQAPDAINIIDQVTEVNSNNLCRYLEDDNPVAASRNTDEDTTFFMPAGISNDLIIGSPYP